LGVDAFRSPKVTHVVAIPHQLGGCDLHGRAGCGAKARGSLCELLRDIHGSDDETQAERRADGFAE
jgi:hypothetical protein